MFLIEFHYAAQVPSLLLSACLCVVHQAIRVNIRVGPHNKPDSLQHLCRGHSFFHTLRYLVLQERQLAQGHGKGFTVAAGERHHGVGCRAGGRVTVVAHHTQAVVERGFHLLDRRQFSAGLVRELDSGGHIGYHLAAHFSLRFRQRLELG